MNGITGYLSGVNMAAQTAEWSDQALVPVVNNDLVDNVTDIVLNRADCPVWDDNGARFDPGRFQQGGGIQQDGTPRR